MLLLPTFVFSQMWRDGRWMNNNSIGGNKLVEQTSLIGWFPVEGDTADTDQGDGPWAMDSSAPPTLTWWGDQWPVYGFDADGGTTGDDIVYLEFVIPADYEVGSLELYFYWFVTEKAAAATDEVEWNASVHVMGSADTLVQTDSSITAIAAVTTAKDSNLYITNMDPETSDIVYTAGDLVRLKVWVDESDSGIGSGEKAFLRGIRVECERKEE